jgi:hypothetical protein
MEYDIIKEQWQTINEFNRLYMEAIEIMGAAATAIAFDLNPEIRIGTVLGQYTISRFFGDEQGRVVVFLWKPDDTKVVYLEDVVMMLENKKE